MLTLFSGELGEVMIAWQRRNMDSVEIRLNSPDGALIARGGRTGCIVNCRMSGESVVYFQNVGYGLPLHAAHSLGTAR
jgi:hypothetical protein